MRRDLFQFLLDESVLRYRRTLKMRLCMRSKILRSSNANALFWLYEGSNSGSAIKPKNSKTTSRHRNTVEYIAGKSFLFISLKEKLDLTLFSVRRSQYFISHTKSHIFKGKNVCGRG